MTTTRRTKFLIVTPSYNAPEFLNETIESVVSQTGNFDIHYHIQDGGSKEPTTSIIRAWDERLRDGFAGSGQDGRIRFSWRAEPDRSMYDAIQKGFDALLTSVPVGEREQTLMTWINSDDRFTPNAFRTAAQFLVDNPEECWVTGLPCTMREDGCIADTRLEDCGYARVWLARGEYDGRRLPPVMQEGTFWTVGLWEQVGGLNVDLRLAGDWDLWRRMARFARLINLRAVLAYHRRRPGQLSGEMTHYWAEVDDVMARADPAAAPVVSAADRMAMEGAWMAAWRANVDKWVLSPMRSRGRGGFLHCLSDCLVESWSHYSWGRALIKFYRRMRGVEVE